MLIFVEIIVMKHLIIGLLLILVSCNGIDDVKDIKIGTDKYELKSKLGSPWLITYNNGYEEWHYTYYYKIYDNNIVFLLSDNKVYDFYTN